MKNLVLIMSLVIGAFAFTACNETKMKAVDKLQESVESSLTKAYEDVEIAGYDCADEVSIIGKKVHDKAAKILRVRESAEGFIGTALIKPVCKIVVGKYLPGLIINSSGSDYKCLKFVGAEGIKKMSTKLCDYIKL